MVFTGAPHWALILENSGYVIRGTTDNGQSLCPGSLSCLTSPHHRGRLPSSPRALPLKPVFNVEWAGDLDDTGQGRMLRSLCSANRWVGQGFGQFAGFQGRAVLNHLCWFSSKPHGAPETRKRTYSLASLLPPPLLPTFVPSSLFLSSLPPSLPLSSLPFLIYVAKMMGFTFASSLQVSGQKFIDTSAYGFLFSVLAKALDKNVKESLPDELYYCYNLK